MGVGSYFLPSHAPLYARPKDFLPRGSEQALSAEGAASERRHIGKWCEATFENCVFKLFFGENVCFVKIQDMFLRVYGISQSLINGRGGFINKCRCNSYS